MHSAEHGRGVAGVLIMARVNFVGGVSPIRRVIRFGRVRRMGHTGVISIVAIRRGHMLRSC